MMGWGGFRTRPWILCGILLLATGHAEFRLPPPPAAYVHDGAGLLSPQGSQRLSVLLSNLDRQAGIQLVLATFPSLQGEVLEDVTMRLAEGWHVGRKQTDSGLLLAVFVQDKKMRIEVGYGLEDKVTDAKAQQVINQILAPAFKLGQYDEGLWQAALYLSQQVAPQPEDLQAASPGATQTLSHSKRMGVPLLGLLAALLVFFALGSVFNRRLLWSELIVALIFVLTLGLIGLILGLVYMFVLGGATTARAQSYGPGGVRRRGYFEPLLAAAMLSSMMGSGRHRGGGFGGFSGGGGGFGGGGASGGW